MTDLPEKVKSTVSKYSMLGGGETVLVGLSGGADSVCLLKVLSMLGLGLKLHALYIDHGLRPGETPGEIEFSRGLAESVGAGFVLRRIDAGGYAKQRKMNRQDAARRLRYGVYEEASAGIGAERVALGHTADDNLETFLMNLLRGAGPKGLSGIPKTRGKIIRPLIETERAEIEDFLKAEGIGCMTDSSNLKSDYLRNRLRHSVIPILRDINPCIAGTFSKTAEILNEEERYFDILVTKALMKVITGKRDNAIELFLAPLEAMEKVLLRRLLRRAALETEGLCSLGFENVEKIIGLIKGGRPGDRLYLPGKIRAIKKYSTLLMTSEPPPRLGSYVLMPPGEVLLKESGAVLRADMEGDASGLCADGLCAVFDAGKAPLPLAVRARERGDFFYPLGFGKRKKLQDFFVDEKVPRDERDAVPVVTAGDEIIWIAGMRGDERFKTDGGTRRFLVLRLRKLHR